MRAEGTIIWLLRQFTAILMLLAVMSGTLSAQPTTSPNWLDSANTLRTKSPEQAIAVARAGIKATLNDKEEIQLALLAGTLFTDLARYDSAQIYLTRALSSASYVKDSTAMADAYHQSARAYQLSAKYKEAIAADQRAFVLYQKTQDEPKAIQTLISLGQASFRLKRNPQAKDFYQQALERATRRKDFEAMVDSHEGLAAVSEATKDYRTAILHVRLMQGAYDSIVLRDHRKKLNELEDKYSKLLEEKDRELVSAEANHRRVQTDRLLRLVERDDIRVTFFSVAIVLLFIALSLLAAWLMTRRHARVVERKLLREQAAVRMANEQFEIIAHQIQGELQADLSAISLATKEIEGKSAGSVADRAKDIQTQSVSLIGQMNDFIWLVNPNNHTIEAFISFLRERINSWLKESGVTYMIVVPDRVPAGDFTLLERMNLYHVTKELVVHVLNYGKETGVTFSITSESKQLIFQVKDSSTKTDDARVALRAEQIKPLRERMDQIDGTIGVVRDGGAMVVIYRKEIKN